MKNISTEALVKAMVNDVPVVDVRESFEYNEGHIPTAKNIPLSELELRYSEVAPETYIICRSGARSQRAVDFLATKGILTTNVLGGTQAWDGCLVKEE
ncbi:rhodanese-like domain-containing protein [Lactococcus taiwanensis]|uniref:rhodanese-like domain-containing protein n=1 Tax=Lactococcus taiwanensis TaxID=1151742 RepID=UPI0019087427|nr:rhodanese-like domain-containing protein [Lactococcus taiwanensis]